MVEKGMSCVKYLLFAFNLLFFIFGVLLVALGAYVQAALSHYFDFTGSPANPAAIVLIVVGVITLVVGFLGCCGAIKENHCMVMTFAILIGIILIIEIAAGIAAFVMKGNVTDVGKQVMNRTMEQYGKSGNDGVTNLWNTMQKDLKCCGTDGPKDWDEVEHGDDALKSCGSNTDGCYQKLMDFIESKIGIVAGAGIGLAIVELVGIILSCCLARAIRSEYEVA